MILRQLFDRNSCTYTYVLGCVETRVAVIIDPVAELVNRDLTILSELDLQLTYILETHVHADHVTGAAVLRQYTGAQNGLSKAACATCADLAFEHGDCIEFGTHTLGVRSTPGHTSGCVTYVLQEQGQTYAFTGDAMMVRGCGRTDFQGGCAQTLYRSVRAQLFSLPPETIIFPGHDYRGHQQSTVAEEMAHNPRLNERVLEADFVGMMAELNLSDPKMMDVAVPANQACGVTDVFPSQFVRQAMMSIEPDALQDQHGYTVIDVREADEFDGPLGHLDDAELVPLRSLSDSAHRWQKDESLLLVCRSGARSAQACKVLLDRGFSNVTNLAGGMIAVRGERFGSF
jgi:sulfur dioxygenase